MSDLPIFLAYYTVFGMLTFVGVLMLIAADGSLRTLHRIFRIGELSRPTLSSTGRDRLQWRLAGFIMSVGGICMMILPIFRFRVSSTAESAPAPKIPAQVSYVVLVAMLFAVCLVGLYLAIRPHAVVFLSKEISPLGTIPENGRAKAYIFVRIVGVCLATAAIYLALVLLQEKG